jgi:acyl carrier protein
MRPRWPVKSVIIDEIIDVASEQGKTVASLQDGLILLDSGLDSLCFAILVARLEDKLGVDPFMAGEDVYLPVTFADFVKFYEDAINRG